MRFIPFSSKPLNLNNIISLCSATEGGLKRQNATARQRRAPRHQEVTPPEVPKTGPSRGATLLSSAYDINVMFFYNWAGVMQSGASWAALFTMGVTS
jgi:hypothetical protein